MDFDCSGVDGGLDVGQGLTVEEAPLEEGWRWEDTPDGKKLNFYCWLDRLAPDAREAQIAAWRRKAEWAMRDVAANELNAREALKKRPWGMRRVESDVEAE